MVNGQCDNTMAHSVKQVQVKNKIIKMRSSSTSSILTSADRFSSVAKHLVKDKQLSKQFLEGEKQTKEK